MFTVNSILEASVKFIAIKESKKSDTKGDSEVGKSIGANAKGSTKT